VNETARLVRDFLKLALEHPEGPATAAAFDRTFQFALSDDAPFYVQLTGGALTVAEGDCGLDWAGRDWERATCVHTSVRVLREIMAGRRIVSEAFFDGELGFAPQRAATRHLDAAVIVTWFYTLVRLAREQTEARARERYLADLGVS
jgi:hypothetical protein